MNTAPNGGAGLSSDKKEGRHGEPGDLRKAKISEPSCSASPRSRKAPASEIRRTKDQVQWRNVVTKTRTPDDPQARERRKAAAARAGHILAQMRRLLDAGAGPNGDPHREEVWFEAAVSQFVAIEATRPKWTFGARAWAKKHLPGLYARQSAAWIEERIQDHRQEWRCYSPATLGGMLDVTRGQFLTLRLFHLWPKGMSAADRKRLSLDMKAARARGYREKDGATPRAKALCNTNARLPGESKSAFYRRIAREAARA